MNRWKKNVYFAFSKVSQKIFNDILNIKTIVYVVYYCWQTNKKTFKKLKTKIRNDISKLYKNFILLLYLSVKFNVNIFNFN